MGYTPDKAVDAVFGLKNPTDADRLAALFANYEKLIAAEQLQLGAAKRHGSAYQSAWG